MPKFGALAYLWISEWNDETGAYALRQAAAASLDLIEIPMPNPGIFNAVLAKRQLAEYGIEGV
jgi:hypothetical protein